MYFYKKLIFNSIRQFLLTNQFIKKFNSIHILIIKQMAKSQDSKKNVKKEAVKTTKEKKAEKKLKKSKYE